jgi:ribosomal protein L29
MLYEVRYLRAEKLEQLYLRESQKLSDQTLSHNTIQAIKKDLASIITELAERGLMDFRNN